MAARLQTRPRPFQQLRQIREHAGRIPAACRGFAGRECDFPQGLTEACDAVHHEEYFLSAITKVFRYGHRGIGGLSTHQWTGVRGCYDNDRFCGAHGAKFILKELPNFPSTLSHQRDDTHVAGSIAREHGKQ